MPSHSSAIPSPPSLSLPKGGGAIRGMGEKVDVAAATGASNASIPITVSAGRGGMQPNLSLQYSSGQGNGPFGLGWRLAVPNITRKTDKGLPRYRDAGPESDADVFLLSDVEDLVPIFARDAQGNLLLQSDGTPLVQDTISGNYKVRMYQPRIEGLFSRIERWMHLTDQGDIHWRAITVNNVTTLYGTDDNSRLFDPASVEGSAKCIFSWLPSESFDNRGNAMIFQYKAEDTANVDTSLPHETGRSVASRSAHRYLKTIRYGNQVANRDPKTWVPTPAALLPDSTWCFTVLFDYGEHDINNPNLVETSTWSCRLDPFSTYKPGFEDRVYRLCRRVLMFHQFAELGKAPLLVRSTDFTYDENATASKLTQCLAAGYSPSGQATTPYIRSTLPPLQYEYSAFPSDSELATRLIQEVDPAYLENLPIGVDGSSFQWLDLYSEGLPGVFSEQDGGWFFTRNSSANHAVQVATDIKNPPTPSSPVIPPAVIQPRFEPSTFISVMPSLSIKDGHARFGDVSGDGHLDVINTQPGCWGFFEATEDKGWTEFRAFQFVPNIPFTDTKLIDLTGDGLADLLIAGDQLYTWCQSLGDCGFGEPTTVAQANQLLLGPASLFSDTENNFVLADFSGDGLQDIVRIRNGDICYWPNLGYGRFGAMIRMNNAPWFEPVDLFETKRVHLADIDGSGTMDLLYVHPEGVNIYLNQSGNSFSDLKRINSFPENSDMSTVEPVDLLGNGTTCLVWSTLCPLAVPSLRYLDIIGGPKPHLLAKVVNNAGKETSIYYAPSTKFYLDDRQEGRSWPTRLPFPVYCVEKVDTVDRITGNRLVNKYRYHDGFYDGVEREFRGFAMVETWDTENYAEMSSPTATNVDASWHVPPIHTKTWYHTGVFIDNSKFTTHWAHAYFGTIPGVDHNLLDDTVLPTSPSLGGDELREACRALKGHILRVEVYADDGTTKVDFPYSVSESNYTIEVVQQLQDANRHSIYWVHPREKLSYSCEREPDDPRIQHEMTLQVDAVGNVLKSLKIAYGRTPGKSTLTGTDLAKQQTSLFLYTENDVTNAVNSDYENRGPSIYETRVYEVSGLTPEQGTQFRFSDLDSPNFTTLTGLPEIPFEQANSPTIKQKRQISRSRIIYRRDDLTAFLPAGQIQASAIGGCEYHQCLTPGIFTTAFQRQLPGQPMEILLPQPSTVLAGTGAQQGGYVALNGDGNWWVPSGRAFFSLDPSASPAQELSEARMNFFTARRFVDPFGNSTVVVNLDNYVLFPTGIQDPIGNTKTVAMDYRVLLPTLITDPNGNRAATAFDALGFAVGTAVMGKQSDNLGDSLVTFQADLTQAQLDEFFATPRGSGSIAAKLLGSATSRTLYDPNRYWRTGSSSSPVYSATISRETHVSELASPATSALQVSFQYMDGFARVIQSKNQDKPGPLTEGGPASDNRWTGSGWVLFNNKGLPVRKYEPFFDDTHEFKDLINGVSTISFYDPLGRVVGTLGPDKTLTKVRLDSWMHTMYDGNDNVMISEPKADPDLGVYVALLPDYESTPSWYDLRISGAMGPDQQSAAQKAAAHANTPVIVHLDVLGRTFMTIKDNGPRGTMTTRSSIDIQGNQYEQYDALNRLAMYAKFNMTGTALYTGSPDSGERWALADVMSRPFLTWNGRGFRERAVYDANSRLIESYSRHDGSGNNSPESLVAQYIYGETVANADASNLRGQAYLLRDQSGTVTTPKFDFKSNLLRSERRFAQNYKTTLDWSRAVALETNVSVSAFTYDALNRIVTATTADGSVTYRIYNETGRLEQVWVNLQGQHSASDPTTWTSIISTSDYNARGQVTQLYHGNGVRTTRSYDANTFRLTGIKSVLGGITTTTGTKKVLQNLSYFYDPVGNITSTKDAALQTIYFRNTVVDPSNDYTYDPVYRLISARGREHLGQNRQPNVPMTSDRYNVRQPQPGDGNAMARYTETYIYDDVDNMTKLVHAGSDATAPGWTRTFRYEVDSNRMIGSSVGGSSMTGAGTAESYTYDEHGNMTALPPISALAWNFLDQLQSSSRQVVGAGNGTPETTYYTYDVKGNRTRKVTERAAMEAGAGSTSTTAVKLKERRYVDASEMYRTYAGDGTTVMLERETLSINGEIGREALVETRTVNTNNMDNSAPQQIRFQLDNNIGSAVLELGLDGAVVSYEEYFPFGSTSYQAVASLTDVPKRYRHTGKERDEESGLYYCGARYYASWLGRWTSVDPLGEGGGGGGGGSINPYVFVVNNPIKLVDPDGRAPQNPGQPPSPRPAAGRGFADMRPSEIGTVIHEHALPRFSERLTAIGLMNETKLETTKGGSKNMKTTEETGEIDLGIATMHDLKAMTVEVAGYELKPARSTEAEIQKDYSEIHHYSDYKLMEPLHGFKATKVEPGHILAVVEKVAPQVFAPIPIEYNGHVYDVTISVTRHLGDSKVSGSGSRSRSRSGSKGPRQPNSRIGDPVDGLLSYTWKERTGQKQQQEQEAASKQAMTDKLNLLRVSTVATPGAQAARMEVVS